MTERTTMPDLTGAAELLRDMADRVDRGPNIPLPPGVYSALLRERADDLDQGEGRPWLVWSNQHGMWWRPDERGYTSRIDEAGRYTKAHADRIVAKATCDGELTYDREDPVTGRAYVAVDEVVVAAPPD